MKNKRWKRKARKLHGKCMRAASIREKIKDKELSFPRSSTCSFCEFGTIDNDLNIDCKEGIWGASIRELEKCLRGG